MSRVPIALISVLTVSTLALALALGIVLASDNGEADSGHRMDEGYGGVAEAMAAMDSEAMLPRMRDLLGEQRYAAIVEHMQDHRDDTAEPHGADADGMMHEMMDGMMSTMPADAGGHMFPNDQKPMPAQPGHQN